MFWKASFPFCNFITGVLELFDSSIKVITLGIFGSSFGMRYIVWNAYRRAQKEIATQKREEEMSVNEGS